jgi:hypothetical protein
MFSVSMFPLGLELELEGDVDVQSISLQMSGGFCFPYFDITSLLVPYHAEIAMH